MTSTEQNDILRPTRYHTREFHITVFRHCLRFQGSVKGGLYVFGKLSHDTAQRAPESKHMHKEGFFLFCFQTKTTVFHLSIRLVTFHICADHSDFLFFLVLTRKRDVNGNFW